MRWRADRNDTAKAEALLAAAPVGPGAQASTEAAPVEPFRPDLLGSQPVLRVGDPVAHDLLTQPFGSFVDISTDMGLDMDSFVDFDSALNLADADPGTL